MRIHVFLLIAVSFILFTCKKENHNKPNEFDDLFTFEEKIIDDEISLFKLKFADEDNGYLIGFLKRFLSTTDGGDTWQEMDYDFDEPLVSLEITNNKTIYVGKFGLYKSTDNGKGWENLGFREWETTIFDICFLDNDTGFIIKSDIYKTTDAGQNWQSVLDRDLYSIGYSNIDKIIFPEKKRVGYAIGGSTYDGMSGGVLFRSIDYGNSWERINLTTSEITEIYFHNDSVGYLFNAYHEILKTEDYGETWELILEDSKCMYPKVQFFNNNEAIMVYRNSVYYTNDACKSWSVIYNTPEIQNYLTKYNSNTFIVTGNNGYYLSITRLTTNNKY